MRTLRALLSTATLTFAVAACAAEAPDDTFATNALPLVVADMEPLTRVHVSGEGELDVETDYLPKVVCCEHGGAHAEALKAQAVMARTYLHFIYFSGGKGTAERPLSGTTSDQAYHCARAVTDDCRSAVAATAGEITAYSRADGELVANVSFFVDGPRPGCLASGDCACDEPQASTKMTPDDHPAGCDCFDFASMGAANPSFVTYNWGLEGDAVAGSTIGSLSHESNRGCASQNIQNCLARAGWPYADLLLMFYGGDIELRYADGRAVSADDAPPAAQPEQGGGASGAGPGREGDRAALDGDPGGCAVSRAVGPGNEGRASALGLLVVALAARRRRRGHRRAVTG
jgi:hypothetical protein